jgi:erythromycin esterase-like protein
MPRGLVFRAFQDAFPAGGRPLPCFLLLPLRRNSSGHARDFLLAERLERAIGVIYRPQSELVSHYFHAALPRQFDEWIWFDESRAVEPLGVEPDPEKLPETFPFGL